MSNPYRDRLLGFGTALTRGQTKTTAVRRDDGPGLAGRRIEHGDGRVDAVITPPPVHLRSDVGEPG